MSKFQTLYENTINETEEKWGVIVSNEGTGITQKLKTAGGRDTIMIPTMWLGKDNKVMMTVSYRINNDPVNKTGKQRIQWTMDDSFITDKEWMTENWRAGDKVHANSKFLDIKKLEDEIAKAANKVDADKRTPSKPAFFKVKSTPKLKLVDDDVKVSGG